MPGQNYAGVEALAARFAGRLRGALGHRMIGLYFVGSFALGDLQPGSDLDFVAVLAESIAPPMRRSSGRFTATTVNMRSKASTSPPATSVAIRPTR